MHEIQGFCRADLKATHAGHFSAEKMVRSLEVRGKNVPIAAAN